MVQRAWIGITAGCAVLASAVPLAAQSHDGDLIFVGKAARLESGRSVEAAIVIGEDLVVAGNVDGIAAAVGGDVHVLRGAHIDGAVVAIGGELVIDEGATVDGMRITVPGGDFNQVAADLAKARPEPEPARWAAGPSARLGQLVLLLVFGSLLMWLAPRYVLSAQRALTSQPALAIAVGFGAMLLALPLSVLLLLSVVGIPLILVVALAFMAAMTLGMSALALTLGQATKLIKRPDNLMGALLLGIAIMAVAALLPFLGAALGLLATMLAVGASLMSRFGSKPLEPSPPGGPAPTSDHGMAGPAGAAPTTAQT